MRIVDLRKLATSDGAQVVARIIWEDARRPDQELVVRTEAPFDVDLEARPAAFVAAAAVPAYDAGERRIAVDGAVCPRLRDGLETVLRTLRGWYPPARPLPTLEPSDGFVARRPAATRRAATFLSGGVDSLDALRENAEAFPADHPRRIRDAFFVHGLDIGAPRQRERLDFFARARGALGPVLAASGASLVPVFTNVRTLHPDGKAWPAAWFGPGTIALAHAFDARVTEVLFAASLDVEGLAPVGSHPMTDPSLASSALDVRHEGAHRSRLVKLRALADWAPARRALRVCWQDLPDAVADGGALNCGRCRKCVRALLGLEALGVRRAFTTFPDRPLVVADLEACTVDPHMVRFYEDLLVPLEARGRGDLAAGLRGRLEAWRVGAGPAVGWRPRLRRWLRRR